MQNNFLIYLKESLSLNPPVRVKKNEPTLDIKTDEKSVQDIPILVKHMETVKGKNLKNNELIRKLKKERASILKKYNLKIENNEIVSKEEDNDFLPNIKINNNLNDFNDEIKNKIKALTDEIELNEPKYKKNLKKILKRFFTVNRKIPKRYIYLPIGNTLNFKEIEAINNNSHLDILLKIKNGRFVQLEKDDQMVFDYLIEFGYKLTVEQYIKNICVNMNGKEVPIDKELTNIAMINIDQKKKALEKQRDQTVINKIKLEILKKEKYQDKYLEIIKKVKTDSNINNNSVIVLTWIPRLIFLQSTNTIWDSCMKYSFTGKHGVNINFVPTGIEAGVFIAWLVNLDDRKITKPIARTLLKPFRDEKDLENEQYFYWPSQIYTTGGQTNIISMFKKTLTNYCIYKQRNLVKGLSGKKLIVSDGVYTDSPDKSMYIYDTNFVKNVIKTKESLEDKIQDFYAFVKNAIDLESNDLEEIIDNKNVQEYISGMRNSFFNSEVNFYNIEALLKKAIEFKKPLLIKKLIDTLNKETKTHFLNYLTYTFTHMTNYEKEFYINNIVYFKYMLSLYDKNDMIINNEMFLDSFDRINYLCSNMPTLGSIVKAYIDHFGFKIYKEDKKYVNNLVYSNLKISEINNIFDNLKIDRAKVFRDIAFASLFKINKNNFYYFFNQNKELIEKNEIKEKEILSVFIYIMRMECEDPKALEDFLDKAIFTYNDKEKLNYGDNSTIVEIYDKIIGYQNFNILHKKILEKNISIKKLYLDDMKHNAHVYHFNEFMYYLYSRTDKESKDLYNDLYLAAISDQSSQYNLTIVSNLLEKFFYSERKINDIIKYVKAIPVQQKNVAANLGSNLIYGLSSYLVYGKYDNKNKEKNCELMQLLLDKNILSFPKEPNKFSFTKYTYMYHSFLNESEEMYKKYILGSDNKIKVSDIYEMFNNFAIESSRSGEKLSTIDQVFNFIDKHKKDIVDDTDFEFYKTRARIDLSSRITFNFLPVFDIVKTMKDRKILNANVFNQYETYILNEIEDNAGRFFVNIATQYMPILPEKYFIKYVNNFKIKLQKVKETNLILQFEDNFSNVIHVIDKPKGITLISILDKDNREYFLEIIFDYIFRLDSKSIPLIKNIVDTYKCEKVIKDVMNSYLKTTNNGYDNVLNNKIINIMKNINFLTAYVEKENILMFVIKNKMSAANDINLLFTKEEFKNKKTQDTIFDALCHIEDNYDFHQIERMRNNLYEMFSKKEIDDLITANKKRLLKLFIGIEEK
jgi:hypothetical protein